MSKFRRQLNRALSAVLFCALTLITNVAHTSELKRVILTDPGAMLFEQRNIDPSFGIFNDYIAILKDLFRGLVAAMPDGSAKPDLALSWSSTDGGTTWVFNLDPDARWSDGMPVSANDFVFAWDRATDSEFSPKGHAVVSATVREYRALDASTLEVKFSGPNATEIVAFDGPHLAPLPSHATPNERIFWSDWENRPSNGAYTLKNINDDGEITLERNFAVKYGDLPTYKKVIYRPLVWSMAARQLLHGQVDLIDGVSPRQMNWFEERGFSGLKQAPLLRFYVLNKKLEGISNDNVRRALNISIDRQSFLSKLVAQRLQPADTLVPDGFAGYKDTFENAPQAERVSEAKSIMTDAGYGPDHLLNLVLEGSERKISELLHHVVANQWKEIYVNLELAPLHGSIYDLFDKVVEGDVQVAELAWSPNYESVAEILRLCEYLPPAGCGFADIESTSSFVRSALGESDIQAKLEYYQSAEEELLSEQTLIPLVISYSEVLLRSDIGFNETVGVHKPVRSYALVPDE